MARSPNVFQISLYTCHVAKHAGHFFLKAVVLQFDGLMFVPSKISQTHHPIIKLIGNTEKRPLFYSYKCINKMRVHHCDQRFYLNFQQAHINFGTMKIILANGCLRGLAPGAPLLYGFWPSCEVPLICCFSKVCQQVRFPLS